MTGSRAFGLPNLRLQAGDHICALYSGPAERDAVLVPFLRAGLVAGDKCLCVVDSTPTDEVVDRLREDPGLDVEQCLSRGQLVLGATKDIYLGRPSFSAEGMIQFWVQLATEATGAEGFAFVRGAGEMAPSALDVSLRDEFFRYEAELNSHTHLFPQAFLCLYDLPSLRSGDLVHAVKAHPRILLGGKLIDNPYFLSEEQLLAEEP